MPSNELRERRHGLLWFGTDANGRDRWSITDPQSEQLAEAYRRLKPDSLYQGVEYVGDKLSPEEKQHRADLHTVLRCVEDYRHLTTYALGVEHIIKKLRVIWRALRDNPEKTDDRQA